MNVATESDHASAWRTLDAWPGTHQIFDGLYPFALNSAIVGAGSEPRAVAIGEISPGLLQALGMAPIWEPEQLAGPLRALVRHTLPDAPIVQIVTAHETIAGANARLRSRRS